MVEQRDGWFVKNVRDARWARSASFGLSCGFDSESPFPQIGIHIFVLEPGKPNCHYHREEAQENFLVLSGSCKLLINDEERELNAWDFVHCPPGATHVFVGTDAPCALLAIGHRPEGGQELFYPVSELAARHGAQTPEPTADPRVSYKNAQPRELTDAPEWPLTET